MQQLECGFTLSAILDELTAINPNLKTLLNKLSYFKIETNTQDTKTKISDSIVAAYYNLISRGLPTYCSTFIEDIFSNTFIKTHKNIVENKFEYSFVNDEYNEEIIKALHIIDPRQPLEQIVPKEILENPTYKSLFIDNLDINIGRHFIQKFSYHRPLKNIFELSSNRRQLYELKTLTTNDITKISCEIPYTAVSNGIIIDSVSVEDKNTIDYFELENINENLRKINWQDKIIFSSLFASKQELKTIEEFSYEKYFDILRKNYTSPLYKSYSGLVALQMALTPFAIARLQKVILQSILQGKLNMSATKWQIGVIERDVPASYLAVEDLKAHFEHFFTLEGKNRKLPKIELTIYNTPEFEQAEINLLYQGKIQPLEEFDKNKYFDLLIDLSVLQYHNFSPFIENSANSYVRVLSADYYENQRFFEIAPKNKFILPNFNPTISKDEKQKKAEQKTLEALTFFLKNIFHIQKLSYLQIKFISQIFSNENTLASVPTQENFEHIYILASLLQPGVNIVITYLMANIKFRMDSLFANHIDCLSYYSPSTQNIFDKIQALNKLKTAQSIFNFITPDRLHILQFREILNEISQNPNHISYITIKHAHCVSERSFDFNPLYPSIYKNFKNIFNIVPQIMCLSDTASYDVIEDISYYYYIPQSHIICIELKLSNINLNFVEIDEKNVTDFQSLNEKKFEYIQKKLDNKKTVLMLDNPLEYNEKLNDKNIKSVAFEGTIDYKSHFISTTKSRQSYRNYRNYTKNDNINVLCSNITLPLSCTINCNQIVFNTIPFSIELFIQTLNKAYIQKKVDVDILFSNKKIFSQISNFVLTQDNQFYENIINEEIEIDNILRKNEFSKFFPSLKKETQIIKELWHNISLPKETLADIICRRVYFSFDKHIKLEVQHIQNPTKIYIIDNNEQTLGFIDFQDELLVNQAPQSQQEIVGQILEFIQFDIEKIVSEPMAIFQILNEPLNENTSSLGIYTIISNLKNDTKQNVTIEFYNSAANDFLENNKQYFKITPTFNQIIYLYEQSTDEKTFIENLFSSFVIEDNSQNEHLINEISKLYNNFRTFYDTLLAIYRLYSINIIDDFLIDFQNQHFNLIITKKNETDILNTIYKKISVYLPKKIAFEVFEHVHKYPGTSVVEKAINYYEKFIFETIRQEQLTQMYLIETYIKNNIKEPQKLIPLLNNYFTAKYLFELEKYLEEDNLFFIDKYFDKKYIFFDDLKHIYRSSELLLNLNTDNHNMLIINGLCGIMLSKDKEEELNQNIEKLCLGISNFRNLHNEDKFLSSKIENILNIINKFDYELKNKINDIVYIKIHSNWLNNFNRKIKHIFNSKLK